MAITPSAKQQECIDAIEGPVTVLAGPGTGKTFTVIQRIANMLKKGIKPEEILCLTFSEAAAREMKIRLTSLNAGMINAGAVPVKTYHSFCADIINRYPEKFELSDNVSVISEIQSTKLMDEIVKNAELTGFKTQYGSSSFYVNELISAVAKIKKSRLTKEQYFENLNSNPEMRPKLFDLQEDLEERKKKGKPFLTAEKKYEAQLKRILKAEEAYAIYEKYSVAMKERSLIDFDDMINFVLDAFSSDEEFLKKAASPFKYFLVDEYQDTNYAQNSIVFELAKGASSNNVFVVGDDDQIIFEFQGANTDTLEKFIEKFPETKVICLTENRRSTQNIADFAYSVISSAKGRMETNPAFRNKNISKKLTCVNEKLFPLNKKINIEVFEGLVPENNFIVDKIEEIIALLPESENGDKDLSQIAILTRTNGESEEFARLLHARNIRYQRDVSKDIFELKPSLAIYFYLKALQNTVVHGDKLFKIISSAPFSFDDDDVAFLLSEKRKNRKDFIFNLRANLSRNWANKATIKNFLDTFDTLAKLKSHLGISSFLGMLVSKTGILNYYINSEINKIQNAGAIKKIFDEAEIYAKSHPGAGIDDFTDELDFALNEKISLPAYKDDSVDNAVQLVTLHKSKGREFEYVFIPHLTADKWEKKRGRTDSAEYLPLKVENPEDDAKIAGMLRLLFVGITRAKHSLFLTYSCVSDKKTNEFTSLLENAVNSSEICFQTIHKNDKNSLAAEVLKSFICVDFDYKADLMSEIKKIAENFPLSASSLTSYEKCPFAFYLANILSVPSCSEVSDVVKCGRALHYALDKAVKLWQNDGVCPSKEKFEELFTARLETEEFDSEEAFAETKDRGLVIINNYYPKFVLIPVKNIYKTEYAFDCVKFENSLLKGSIDRIQQNEDGTYSVIDYKAGSAKSRKSLEDGGDYDFYLNQLRFYKLVFEFLNPEKHVTKGVLLFIADGKEVDFELTGYDNDLIARKINDVQREILSLDFQPHYDKKNCENCGYKELCSYCAEEKFVQSSERTFA